MAATLIIDSDPARRVRLRNALSSRGVASFEVKDPFEGMAALGRADFDAVFFLLGARQLSLRGFCQLARRRHTGIRLVAVCPQAVNADALAHKLGVRDISVLHTDDDFSTALQRILGPPSYARTAAPTVRMAALADDLDTTELPTAGEAGFPEPVSGIVGLGPDEETAPLTPAPRNFPIPAITGGAMPAPVELADYEETAVDATPPPQSSEKPLFDGDLEREEGPRLLMTVAAQELTGRLDIESGDCAGSLYFYGGDPVYAASADASDSLAKYLNDMGFIDVGGADPMGVDDLTRAMDAAGHTAQATHDAFRSYISTRVRGVLTATEGAYIFYDDRSFIDAVPLLRINVFGLWLVHQRGRLGPAELLRQHAALEWLYIHPTAALSSVSPKVKPFVLEKDLAERISGKTTVKRLLAELGYDALMGSLLVLSLRDLGLVTLEDAPRQGTGEVELTDATLISPVPFHMPSSEMEDTTSTEEIKAREDVFAMYMKLKPLQDPFEVLGVTCDSELEAVHLAYAATMAALDEKRVPEGSARELMQARVSELKRKVMWAFAEVMRTLLD